MLPSIPRAIATAVLGALAGAVCLVGAFAWNPAVTFDMNRDLPRFATGFHPVERDGSHPFAWTSDRADVTLQGLDLRAPWTCVVRFRGARAPDVPQPDLVLAVNGVRAGVWTATNDFQEAEVTVPASPLKPGLTLTLNSTTTFVPGADDPRRLGVQVDRLSCHPASGIVLPPRPALWRAALAAALLGAGFALTGVTAGSAIGAAALMAAGQAWAVVDGGAVFGTFPASMVRLAFWTASAMAGLALLLGLLRKEPLRNTARFAIAFSAGALYLQLVALLHPSKAVVDALFHAHRLEWVMAGRFYFTQLSTSATPFPYAIGLYVFAAPWAFLVANHVVLLRVVVSATEALAGGLLYVLVVRSWGNRLVGAVAVALFSLVPLSYVIVGNANLTNAFGQAVSVIAVTVVALSAERMRSAGPFVGAVLLVTLGLVCHVSTVVLLTGTLVAAAALFYWLGAPPLRASARGILLATLLALLASTALYWGHFGTVYTAQFQRIAARVSAGTPAGVAAGEPQSAAGSEADEAPALGRTTLSLPTRAGQALKQTADNLGWPILLLALVGLWRMMVEGGRDRASLLVGAWGLVALALVAFSVVSPGTKTYQQDAWEFISRVEHAAVPAAVLLAARGAVWGWHGGWVKRAASGVLLAAAVVTAIRAWAAWLS